MQSIRVYKYAHRDPSKFLAEIFQDAVSQLLGCASQAKRQLSTAALTIDIFIYGSTIDQIYENTSSMVGFGGV